MQGSSFKNTVLGVIPRLTVAYRQARLFAQHPIKSSVYWRIRLRRLRLRNKTNAPFLSGDGFASLVDYYAYGRSGTRVIDLKALRNAGSIFVNSELLEHLLQDHFSNIEANVIITGNSDKNWDSKPELPPSVSLWLAQNSSVVDPLVATLPLGLENLRHGRSGLKSNFVPWPGRRNESQVLVPPYLNTNDMRPKIVEKALLRPEMFEVLTTYLSPEDYFSTTRRYRFVLCLMGNGYEDHRIWETLYQGNFPVVLTSPWQDTLRYLGLPILAVSSIDELSPRRLQEFVSLNSGFSPADTACLWLPFWKKLIEEHQESPNLGML